MEEQVKNTKKSSKKILIASILACAMLTGVVGLGVYSLSTANTVKIMSYASLEDLEAAFPNPTAAQLKGKMFTVGEKVYSYINSEWAGTSSTLKQGELSWGTAPETTVDSNAYVLKTAYDVALENGYIGSMSEFGELLVKGVTPETATLTEEDILKTIGFDGTYEEFLNSLKGKDGEDGLDGRDGIDGIDGKDGAQGEKGDRGADGEDGRDGVDGVDGTDGRDGLNGRDGRNGADGEDGTRITISDDGFWVLDDEKTTYEAGTVKPTITTNAEGLKVWVIDGVETDIQATPKDVEFRNENGVCQWRYTGGSDTSWTDLFTVDMLRGKGVVLLVDDVARQVKWKVEGAEDSTAIKLFDFEEVTPKINSTTGYWEVLGSSLGVKAVAHEPELRVVGQVTVNDAQVDVYNWFVWDDTTNDYIDSGVRASAIDGEDA